MARMAITDVRTLCRACGHTVVPTDVRCPACNQRVRPLKAREAAVTPACQTCGRWPATSVTFRQVTGIVLAFRLTTRKARLCRDCGVAAFRDATNRTLLAGWWGVLAVFANIVVIAMNLRSRRVVKALSPPHGAAAKPPADPGAPLIRRAGPAVTAALAVAVAIAVVVLPGGPSHAYVGQCVVVDAADQQLKTIDCGRRHDGKVTANVPSQADCPAGTDRTYELGVGRGQTLCVNLTR
jgi:predicted RNA-binding Zn-ribbon protein involved in translation (DUF1610 family)